MSECCIVKEKETGVLCLNLVRQSCWFEVTPLPDGWWQIKTKEEGHLARAGFDDCYFLDRKEDNVKETTKGSRRKG